jgi:predicted acylesterase/phospholipase RssA
MTTTNGCPDNRLVVDPNKIGISYSGGGPLLAVELGVARAFVNKKIYPSVITGVSAGSIAGAAHALDIYNGTAIDRVVEHLGNVTNSWLHLDPGDFVKQAVATRERLPSIGNNAGIGDLLSQVLQECFQLNDITMGGFGQPIVPGTQPAPKLMICASDLVGQDSFWFPDDANLHTALIASSAIPGVFPWVEFNGPNGNLFLVDGAIVRNQPLTNLADKGCGLIYACVVGGSPLTTAPSNLVDNFFRSINLSMHQCMKLEEEGLRPRVCPEGKVIHIHPETTIPLPDFNFTPDLVHRVVDEARSLTEAWLDTNPQS